jgi:hypothetical protein
MLKSEELCVYLERLRSARNISQETFVSDVVSIRQYRRYLNGESDIPFPVVDVLCMKLGIQTIDLLKEMETERFKESSRMINFYNMIVNNSLSEAKAFIQETNPNQIIDPENRILFQHGLLVLKNVMSEITKPEYYKATKALLGYPKFSKKTIFTEVEMLIMSSLLDYSENPTETHEIYNKLKGHLSDRSIVLSSTQTSSINLTLFRLAKYSGRNKQFEDVIEYCKIGIKNNLSTRSFYLMDYFFYFSALAYYRLGDMENYQTMLIKCFNVLHFEGIEKKIQKFTNLINSDFSIHFQDFVLNYYKNQLSDSKGTVN